MATFKVGQRVRIIGLFPATETRTLLGKEGTIVTTYISRIGTHGWAVSVDGMHNPNMEGGRFFFINSQLAPLTDPGFDAFMQSVLKPVNLDQPVTVQ